MAEAHVERVDLAERLLTANLVLSFVCRRRRVRLLREVRGHARGLWFAADVLLVRALLCIEDGMSSPQLQGVRATGGGY